VWEATEQEFVDALRGRLVARPTRLLQQAEQHRAREDMGSGIGGVQQALRRTAAVVGDRVPAVLRLQQPREPAPLAAAPAVDAGARWDGPRAGMWSSRPKEPSGW